ncbi:MAG: 4-amino-4-deoxy-L-arabinose transferase and related glycosyltransferase of family [Acidobacteria bacterium]|nr:4-amino-4-deoxy-L-arabinose transferase and related glycosyltransferase of family [Acidobacteriota bacterium]
MSENTKTKDQKPDTSNRIVWILFAFVVIFIYLFGLTAPLLGPDEPRYSQVAREMFERGDWITPTLGGFDWFEKPALLYWLQIASYNVFGVGEFAARFGSALFGLGTIFSLWILGRFSAAEFFARETTAKHTQIAKNHAANPEFANWLALIAASSIGLIAFARGASFDIILTFPVTASLVAFYIYDLSERRRSAKSGDASQTDFSPVTRYLSLVVFYFFIGIALIAKGLVGIVFPFAIVAFYHVLSWRLPNKTFIFGLFWGTILSLIVASAWYLPMYEANGWKFIDEFFIQHHFQRYTSNKYFHPQPFWFFFGVLPLMTIPWLPFFLASIWSFFKDQRSKLTNQNSRSVNNSTNNYANNSAGKAPRRFLFFPLSSSPLLVFSFAWMLVPVVFFSFSGSKLPGYILPALPAALILTAEYVCRFAGASAKRKRALQFTALLTFFIVAILLQFVVPGFAFKDSVKGLMDTASARGYASEKVLNLHTTSHNSEFYAAGRLVRAEDGKLKKFQGVSEISEEIARQNGKPVLVLVPLEYLEELTSSSLVEAKVLADNTELAIVFVSNK